MWKIHRYYLREVTTTSLLTFLVLFGIVLIASVSRGIERAQGGNLFSAALVTFYWTADTFPHLLAIALLIGTVLTFARASQDREITALRAAGISPRVPLVAAVLLGIAFSLGGAYAHHYLIPKAHYNKYRVVGEAMRNFILNTQMSGGKFAFGNFFLSAIGRDERDHFREVVIKIGKEGNDGMRGANDLEPGQAYYADEAWLVLDDDGETLTLNVQGVRDASQRVFSGVFQFFVNIREATGEDRRKENVKDLTSDQLLSEVARGFNKDAHRAEFTVHKRSCFALMPFLFAPIGFCIGVLARDRGRMTAVLFAMVPMVIFYGSMLVAPTLSRVAGSPVFGWLPAAVVALFGLPFCWKLLRV